ncbi:hypothetical protein [Chryseobacterium gregarium]|uniref:hypothetical protein n=1 Tax=Chryseobacterium gregarium TaxID=456299 RepID=UPI0012DD0E0D|nr:hypothetical protein [Chryseobacterium gregarium]
MAPITKMTPADFQEKQKRQQSLTSTDRTSSGAGPSAAGLRRSRCSGRGRPDGDRISPAAERHSCPADRKGNLSGVAGPSRQRKSPCSLLP